MSANEAPSPGSRGLPPIEGSAASSTAPRAPRFSTDSTDADSDQSANDADSDQSDNQVDELSAQADSPVPVDLDQLQFPGGEQDFKLAKKQDGTVVLQIFDSGTFNVLHIDKASPPVVTTMEVGEYTITAGVITVPATYTPNPLTFKVLPHPREPGLFTLKGNPPQAGRKPDRIIDGRQSPGK